MKFSTKTLVAIVVILASSLLAWNANRRSSLESYGASPYGSYASEMLTFFPPEYRSRESAIAVLADIEWQLREAASHSPNDAVACSLVFQYIDLEQALARIPIKEAWNVRKSLATLRRLLQAVSGENCVGGYTSFRNSAEQIRVLRESL